MEKKNKDESGRKEEEEEKERRLLWKQAIKIPMYTVALSPMLVGSCAAYASTGVIDIGLLFQLIFSAVGIIAWLNLSNDVFDSDTGIDKNKRESVVNLLGRTKSARNSVLLLATLLLIVSLLSLLSITAFDRTPLLLLSISISLGYAYQGPPFRLGYYGLGEPITFLTWFASTAAAYHIQTSRNTIRTLSHGIQHLFSTLSNPNSFLTVPATLVAGFTMLILLTSHFHQIHDDARAGKKSPAVRLGTANTATLVTTLVCLFLALVPLAMLTGFLPAECLLCVFVAAKPAFDGCRFVLKYHDQPSIVRTAKYRFVRIHFLLSITLSFCLTMHRLKLVT